MDVLNLLTKLLKTGIKVTIKDKDGSKLWLTPAERVSGEMVPLIKEHKTEIIAYLQDYSQKRSGQMPVYPSYPCYICGNGDYWLTPWHTWECSRCHPNPDNGQSASSRGKSIPQYERLTTATGLSITEVIALWEEMGRPVIRLSKCVSVSDLPGYIEKGLPGEANEEHISNLISFLTGEQDD